MSGARIVAVVAVLLLGGLIAAPASAAGPTRMHLLPGEASFDVETERYVVWDDVVHPVLHILDTRTRRLSATTLPKGCRHGYGTGRLRNAAGHLALVECDRGTGSTLLVDLRDGGSRWLPAPAVGTNTLTGFGTEDWSFGTRWALAMVDCDVPRSNCLAALSLATGEQRLLTVDSRSGLTPDPNEPDLGLTPFCAPWAATARRDSTRPEARWGDWILLSPGPRYGVVRCGRPGVRRFGPRDLRYWDPSLAGGWTTWMRRRCGRPGRDHVYGYAVTTGRTWDWAMPRAVSGRRTCLDGVGHTAGTWVAELIAHTYDDTAPDPVTYRLLAARRPG